MVEFIVVSVESFERYLASGSGQWSRLRKSHPCGVARVLPLVWVVY